MEARINTVTQEPISFLFKPWLQFWRSDPLLAAQADKAVELIALRTSRGSERKHGPSPDPDLPLVLAARTWAFGEPPVRPDQRTFIAEAMRAAIADRSEGMIWQRWLHLEAALLDGMRTGDLLFAASALRTMLSELSWLHAIDVSPEEVHDLSIANDSSGIDRFVTAVWTILGDPTREQILSGVGFPHESSQQLSARARRARSALNSFVHPNYGSHVAALYPEGREAAATILEAIAATYESLLGLKTLVSLPSLPLDPVVPLDHDGLLLAFETVGLPAGMAAIDRMSPVNPVDAPILLKSLTLEFVDDLSDPILAPVVSRLPWLTDGDIGVQGHATWAGADPTSILSFGMARRSERDLSEAFPLGVPDRAESKAWLSFNVASLDLAIGLTDCKQDMFRSQLLRQIVVGNPLGIWLCGRAMIENHAMALWLPAALGEVLDTMAITDTDPSIISQAADALEKTLAQYLTTQASSPAEARPWSVDKSDGKPRAKFSVTKATTKSFPPNEFWANQYAFGSAAMHGRVMRSIELDRDPVRYVDAARAAGLTILARLQLDRLDTLARGVVANARLRHGADLQNDGSAIGGHRWSWGWDGKALVLDRDYAGSGSRLDPFVMAPHVFFHVASKRLACDTLGLEVESAEVNQAEVRVLEMTDGILHDVWRHGDHECWIRVPPMDGFITTLE